MTFIDPSLFDSLGIFEPGERQAIMQQVAAALPAPTDPTSPAPAPTVGVGGLTTQQRSAQSIIQATLRTAGLDTPELIKWANDSIIAGSTPDQLALELYDPASTPGKVVDKLYPELQARIKNGWSPSSLTEVVSYRNTAEQVARAEGLDPSTLDFTKLIGNNVGLPELQSRIRDNYAAVRDAMPDVVDQLHTIYNLTPGDIAAMVSDPTPGLSAKLLRKFEASQIAAAGTRTGFGQLDQTDAERLAAMGVTADQAQAGFTRLGQLGELTQPLPGEGVDPVSRAQQLAAQFGGDVAAQKAIEDERALRKAQFAGGGGLSAGRGGVGGLGRTDGT